MTTCWHPEHDATPTPRDVAFMAETLEARHGTWAADVAEFFSSIHSQDGDAGRSWAWAGVAELVRHRQRQRMAQD